VNRTGVRYRALQPHSLALTLIRVQNVMNYHWNLSRSVKPPLRPLVGVVDSSQHKISVGSVELVLTEAARVVPSFGSACTNPDERRDLYCNL
jgi:hypothetical protein